MTTNPQENARPRKKTTVASLRGMKADGERITMVTCYDATFARLVDEAQVDVVLVGDSLGMVVQGNENTLAVEVDDIIYHARAVRRGISFAHVVADMPFMSYQAGPQEALKNAGRVIKESGAEAVKLEGGAEIAESVECLVRAGIPVMGHVGLMPQSVHAMGGYKIQGKDPEQARRILDDARAIEAAGAYAIVLEGMPLELARVITQALRIPTIGIGAGVHCDGQVLVLYDLLGLNRGFQPKFLKRYAELGTLVVDAIARFNEEVQAGAFPDLEHSFSAALPLFRPVEVQRGTRASDDRPDDDDLDSTLYGVPV